MGALTITAILSLVIGGAGGGQKRAIVQATGPASYDTNGSVLDLSSANSTLTGLDPLASFTRVDALVLCGVSPHASDRYSPKYIRASAGAPATGTVKVRDTSTVTTGTPGTVDEVASTTDLHTTTFTFEVIGA